MLLLQRCSHRYLGRKAFQDPASQDRFPEAEEVLGISMLTADITAKVHTAETMQMAKMDHE